MRQQQTKLKLFPNRKPIKWRAIIFSSYDDLKILDENNVNYYIDSLDRIYGRPVAKVKMNKDDWDSVCELFTDVNVSTYGNPKVQEIDLTKPFKRST